MTGPEHYSEAERLLSKFWDANRRSEMLRASQVHATLALAAATALCTPNADGIIDPSEYNAWHKTAAVKRGAP